MSHKKPCWTDQLKTILIIIVSCVTIAGALFALWNLAKEQGKEESEIARYKRTTDITVEKLQETNNRLIKVEQATSRIEAMIIDPSIIPNRMALKKNYKIKGGLDG